MSHYYAHFIDEKTEAQRERKGSVHNQRLTVSLGSLAIPKQVLSPGPPHNWQSAWDGGAYFLLFPVGKEKVSDLLAAQRIWQVAEQ